MRRLKVLLRRLLADIRASPLVEEGMLIGVSVITLALLLSLISGIFGGLKGLLHGSTNSFESIFNEIVKELDKIWEYITNLFS